MPAKLPGKVGKALQGTDVARGRGQHAAIEGFGLLQLARPVALDRLQETAFR